MEGGTDEASVVSDVEAPVDTDEVRKSDLSVSLTPLAPDSCQRPFIWFVAFASVRDSLSVVLRRPMKAHRTIQTICGQGFWLRYQAIIFREARHQQNGPARITRCVSLTRCVFLTTHTPIV